MSTSNGHIVDCAGTDHQPTFLTIKLDNMVQKIIPSKSKSYIDYKKHKSDLANESWDGIYIVGGPNQMVINFTRILCQLIKRNTNTISMNNKHTPRHKWNTKGLLNSINEKITATTSCDEILKI
ncbi:hypothetical protein HHI36_009796 [Cryptolaemus montrouzieri]|uniref:Uncharacterized protein n=1 Tax=Cryptolaemus montrouzieri TaxID=559131 RepID=A0ABD2MGV2_9CUCU